MLTFLLRNVWRSTLRHRRILCLIAAFIISLSFFVYIKYIPDVQYVYLNRNIKGKCILPQIDPFDTSILKYIWSPDPIICENSPSLVYINENGMLEINRTSTREYGLQNISCRYSLVVRKGDYDIEVFPEMTLNSSSYISSDVVLVKCYNIQNQLIYDRYHLHVDYRTILQNRKLKQEYSEQLSVYVFGLDSVSKLNADRKLKKTMKFIREKLKAYIFEGHTKVGENTYPNLVPMLLGKKAYSKEMTNKNWRVLDDEPFLWYNFSNKGYVTYFSEDSPQMSTFVGFENSPCDHYIRYFFLALRKIRSYKIHDAFLFFENQKIKLTKVSTMCYGDTPKLKLVIEYIQRLFNVYDKKRKFIMSWLNEISHDYLNFLELADDDVYSHLKWLKDKGKLDNAVLILMSDHGLRVNQFRNTPIGRIEDRMPLFAVALPNHLVEKYPNIHRNMLLNTKRLTTPYDVYEMLVNILNQDFRDTSGFLQSDSLPRGISLFKEIPERRTCYDADVDEHYCPCYSATETSTQDPRVNSIAHFIVHKLNSNLKLFETKCAHLTLEGIEAAQIIHGDFQRAKELEEFSFKKLLFRPQRGAALRFLVVVRTAPSHGLFEATVSFHDGNVSLLGGINRINMYGNQSSCIDHKILRSSCFCLS